MKKIIYCILVSMLILSGCGSKSNDNSMQSTEETSNKEYSLKIGMYLSHDAEENEVKSYLWLSKDTKELNYVKADADFSYQIYSYEIKGNELTAKNEEEVIIFEIVDEETLKINDELYSYLEETSNKVELLKMGEYQATDAVDFHVGSYLWLYEGTNIMLYVRSSMQSSSEEFFYHIKGNEIIVLNSGDESLVFEIVDNETLKLNDIFYYYQESE